jgi:hypothetical protein
MRPVVYIAAPYRGENAAEVRANVAKATSLAAFAVRAGYAPVLPHAHAEVYELAANDRGEEADRVALVCGLDQVRAVARAGGELWILSRGDGSLSNGCADERHAYAEAGGQDVTVYSPDALIFALQSLAPTSLSKE